MLWFAHSPLSLHGTKIQEVLFSKIHTLSIFPIISKDDNIIYGQQLELDALSRGTGKRGISVVTG